MRKGGAMLAMLLGLSSALVSTPARAEPPRRIVSLNLCADQLLVALADRGQIAGLTRLARDPAMSAVADQARTLPVTRGDAEAVLGLRPDLVLLSPYGEGSGRAILKAQGVAMLDVPPAESLDAITAQIRLVARVVGHPDRGEALIRRMARDLSAIPVPGGGMTAAYYQRRGYLTGTGTLVDEMIRRAGLRNTATVLGKPALSRLSLEELVAARPDFLIVESATDHPDDLGSEMLHHPALAGIARISLPQAWTVCGGPAFVRALRSLSDQVARHRRASPVRSGR